MSAEGRARRPSAPARRGAGAAAPEHPRGSESRPPASTEPQRERPRRLARHLPPPQCPRPSRGRAWTRLSKCGAPATGERGCPRPGAPGGGERGRRARRLQVRAPRRALGPLCLAGGLSLPAVTLGALGRRLGGEGEGVSLAPVRVAPLAPGGSPKPPRARKFAPEQAPGEAEARRCSPESVEGWVLRRRPSRSCSVPLSLCPFGPGKGGVPVGTSPVPDSPPPGLLPGPQVEQPPAEPGGPAGRRCERPPRGSPWPPEGRGGLRWRPGNLQS